MSDEPPKIYTADEAAAFLKIVTASWLKRHAADGDIPSVKIGRNRGWTAAQLGDIVLRHLQKPGTARPSRTPAARSTGAQVTPLHARPPRRRMTAS